MIKNVTLEISLKPFRDLSDAGIRAVCETLYRQWVPLFKDVETVAVMFWSADGSEILEYKGRLDEKFEWAKYIGVANPEVYGKIPDLTQEQLCIHHSPRLYSQDAPDFTYGDLKRLIGILRDVFALHGRKISVGATFDPGPEFAKSQFKYHRHRECCMADTLSTGNGELKSFVCCYAELNADKVPYAGFPDGIPAGTNFGTFLGRQTRIFCCDLDFDYIWFSNGFGFGLETWGVCGAVFDGKKFDNAACATIKDKIFQFWTDFRCEAPELPVETRGTNLSTGMDLSSDAVPLREIYAAVPDINPPPNSPWAALNGDFGMELAGWMSHIAELPKGKGYPFRFYTHDPWFINSPWLDRYGRQPHDIYMPLAIARLDENGNIQTPEKVNFLTVDDSYGHMPDQVPDEVIPHVKSALKSAPDAAGPVIWLYPFDEYHDMTFSGTHIEEVFFGDWFMRTAINTGFQVNTVVSTNNFTAALKNGECNGNVVVAPTAVTGSGKVFTQLVSYIENGGKVLLYGPAAEPELLQLLGLATTTGLMGELDMTLAGSRQRIMHNPVYSSGDIDTVKVADDIKIIATVHDDNGEERVAALTRNVAKGIVGWVRGTNSFEIGKNGRYPEMFDRNRYFYPETLMRLTLGEFGYVCEFERDLAKTPEPMLVTNFHANALYMSFYAPDMTVTERLGFPEGAPLFTGTETVVADNRARYHLPKAGHLECRVFVEMAKGTVKCLEHTLDNPEVKRRIEIQGLNCATVRFRPETGYEKQTRVLLDPQYPPYLTGQFLEPEIEKDFAGTVFTFRNVTGKILISW